MPQVAHNLVIKKPNNAATINLSIIMTNYDMEVRLSVE